MITIPIPTQLPLNPGQTINTQFIPFLLASGTIAGHYYLPPGKRAFIYILSSIPPTCPKLQWLVPPSPCQTSMTMPVVVSTGPVSPETSHGCEVLLPPKYGKNSPSSSLCLPFPPETQKSLLFLPPSNCLMAFFTDRSRTNWRKGL